MANIVRRNQGLQQRNPSPLLNELDPFRLIDSLFRGDLPMLVGSPQSAVFLPAFDVRETPEGYQFQADLPGVKSDDVEISVTGNRLTVTGKRDVEETQQQGNFFTAERSFGTFSRTFTLPDSADMENIKADLKDGVLTLVLPKRPEMQARRISLGKGNNPSQGSA